MKSNVSRSIWTVIAVIAYGFINSIINPVSAIMSAKMAGMQFESSDSSYIQSIVGMNFFGHLASLPGLALLAVLVAIWWGALKSFFSDGGAKLMALGLLAPAMFFGMNDNANAYYSKIDQTETYFILPNETAFWIPSFGDRKGNQTALNTVEYFEQNKVSTVLFNIPHKILTGANFGGFDPYVPAGRLIIVDHIPFHQEWAAMPGSGATTANQAISCQSKEGITITVEISITASIQEVNAAKYLYNFGVESPGRQARSNPEVMFQSVYHAKPLEYVMDNNIRGVIVNIACAEISARSFDQANAEAGDIMNNIITKSTKFLNARGITVDSIGWAGTFTFDPKIQGAINDRFVANTLKDSLPFMQAKADIEVKTGLGEGLKKGLPSFLPQSIADWLGKFFGNNDQVVAPVVDKVVKPAHHAPVVNHPQH